MEMSLTAAKLWNPPDGIVPDMSLTHPRVLCTEDNVRLARRRRSADAPAWARTIAAGLAEKAESLRWMKRDDEDIRRVMPKPHAYYMYGVTNPVGPDGTRIHPIGWEAPGLVRSEGGGVYPDEEHPDDGTGWEDRRGNRYYFVARWNGFVVDELTRSLEPLAYAYAVSGDIHYARKAAAILDAIAAVYPTAIEGPLDYPGTSPGKEAGRLERPYYQVARTLIWYVNATDLIWESGVLDEPSTGNPGVTVKENIVYNLLLNGADYCWRESQLPGYVDQLHNGTADYNMGILAVGSLLGIEPYVSWAIDGPTSIRYMIMNNIDRDGNYFETSQSYAAWTQSIYMKMAELLYHVRTPKWPRGLNLYEDPRFARFYIGYREKHTIAGRIPAYGDSAKDVKTDNRQEADPAEAEWLLHFLIRTGKKVEVQNGSIAPSSPWMLFHVEKLPDPRPEPPASRGSELVGGKGLAMLRSGEGDLSRGVMMRFGATLNHGNLDELGLHIYGGGRELSFDPGYNMAHYRVGWQFQTVSHITVAVNGKGQLSQESAGGSVAAFAAAPGLSVVEAADEAAYAKEGVSVYRRLTALVDWSDSRSYMIDLFRVEGGQTRDYSFHSTGRRFETEGVALSDPEEGSVASPQFDWGRRIQGDGKIIDYADESFFFEPPGEGYGFLGRPRRAKPPGVWSASWSDPGSLTLTMLPAAAGHREVIAADGPSEMGVKYVLVRDSGPTPSRFAAVIEPVEKDAASAVIPLRVERGDGGTVSPDDIAFAVDPGYSGAAEVRDYVLSTLGERAVKACDESFGRRLATDAAFAHVRLDAAAKGKVLHAHLVGGTSLQCGEFALTVEASEIAGTVESVDAERGCLRVKVGRMPAAKLNGLYGYVEHSEYSHNSPYRIARSEAMDDGTLTVWLDPGDFVLACGKLIEEPTEGTLPNGVNLPYSRNVLRHGPNRYFDGKLVKSDRGASAVIRAVGDDYSTLEVDDAGPFRQGDAIHIYDVKPGDRFVIPVPVHWRYKEPGEAELNAFVPVTVTAPAGETLEVRGELGWIPAERPGGGASTEFIVHPSGDGICTVRFRRHHTEGNKPNRPR